MTEVEGSLPAAVRNALRRLSGRVLLQLEPPLERGVARVLGEVGVVAVAAEEGSRSLFDGLVAGRDPASWGPALSRVRPGGEALLLLPPGPLRADFDFYAQVHSRSLRLRAFRTQP